MMSFYLSSVASWRRTGDIAVVAKAVPVVPVLDKLTVYGGGI